MEFQKNLKTIRESACEDAPVKFDQSLTKLRINECLFEIMPATTTINELDDLALAIFATVSDAWFSTAPKEAAK